MTASTDTTPTPGHPKSRRALLAGALGGLGAWAASAIGRASPVRGANGDTVTVGGSFTGTSPTAITNANGAAIQGIYSGSGSGSGVEGSTPGGGIGVFGHSSWGHGVWGVSNSSFGVKGDSSLLTGVMGSSTSGTGVDGTSGDSIGVAGGSTSYIGVFGQSWATDHPAVAAQSFGASTGVQGYSGDGEPPAPKPKTGVYGYASQDSGSRGVWGFSGQGVGVFGQANKNGHAIRGSGRVKFDKVSGVATIAAGNTGVTVNPGVNVTSGSFVLLTPKTNIGSRGLWFTTQPAADTFRMRMSSARSSNTRVAWLLLG